MRSILVAAAVAALSLTACGPGPAEREAAARVAEATGPTYSGTGTIASAEGQTVAIQHEALPEAGLAAGTTSFRTYADVVAVAPGEAGANVAFSFRKAGEGYELTELTAAS